MGKQGEHVSDSDLNEHTEDKKTTLRWETDALEIMKILEPLTDNCLSKRQGERLKEMGMRRNVKKNGDGVAGRKRGYIKRVGEAVRERCKIRVRS